MRKGRERFFQHMMSYGMTADEMRCAGANSVLPGAFANCLNQVGMIGETEIIVAEKREEFTPRYRNPRILRTFQSLTTPVQVLRLPTLQLFAQFVAQVSS